MSKYQYEALCSGSGKIRLLRLLPHPNPSSDVKCELFKYSIQTFDCPVINGAARANELASSLRSRSRTHFYEALSYVWGSAAETRTIFVNNHAVQVTVNLHAALLRLRNHALDRVLWVDALCINQEDEVEKADQVQIMASIYAQAIRVVVWLGEEADGSDEALDYLRAVAETVFTGAEPLDEGANHISGAYDSLIASKLKPGYVKQQLVIKLLQRPWFSRIWVLQEVGAARQVSVLCGVAEIDSYVFSTGLTRIASKLAEFRTPMGAMTYWMRRAIFRTRNGTFISGEPTLGELIDMYHTYQATVQHDKIYALLGMSSDNPSPARLQPNYAISWAAVFQELVSFLISPDSKVCAFDGKEMAVIRSKGFIIGEVLGGQLDFERPDKQQIWIVYTTPMSWEYEHRWGERWTIQTSAKAIQRGDVICVLAGAPRPTIIRMYKDYSEVIMIGPQYAHKGQLPRVSEEEYYSENFLRDFLLVWDWTKEKGGMKREATFDAYRSKHDLFLKNTAIASSQLQREYDMGLLARDVGDFATSETRLQEMLAAYKATSIANHPIISGVDKGCAYTSATEESIAIISAVEKELATLYTEKRRWEKAETLFWETGVSEYSQAGFYGRSLFNLIAPEVVWRNISPRNWPQKAITGLHGKPCFNIGDSSSSNAETDNCISAKEMGRARLLSRYIILGRVSPVLAQEVIQGRGDPERYNIYISEEVLLGAAGRPGPGMLDIFLDMPKELLPMTQAVAERAASNNAFGVETVMRMLDEWPSEVKITRRLQEVSASNNNHSFALVKFLFERSQNTVPLTTMFLLKALGTTRTGGLDMIRLLLETRLEEVKALWTLDVMQATAGNAWFADPIMGLVAGKAEKGSEDLQQTMKMLESSVSQAESHDSKAKCAS